MGSTQEASSELPPDLEAFLADFPTPSELDELHSQRHPLPIHDAAIKWLAGYSHPQQRRQLLHIHKRKLDEFIEDSNAQWDSDTYITNRYSRARALETLFATTEMKQNIETTTPEDGGNVPLNQNGVAEDELSMNELQLSLSNQAALLRMNMANEYEDMRIFQNKELETLLKAKAKKEPDFQKLVDEARVQGSRPQPARLQTRQLSQRDSTTAVTRSPTVQSLQSPALSRSPDVTPDLNKLKTDASLPEFFKFFLHLRVVQRNWSVISRSWSQYISFFHRNLFNEKAFAKAILGDAVNSSGNVKFAVEPEQIQKTREAAQNLPEKMHMSRIITEAVLELAEKGAIEFTSDESPGETLAPNILVDVMSVERRMLALANESTNVEKTKDSQQR